VRCLVATGNQAGWESQVNPRPKLRSLIARVLIATIMSAGQPRHTYAGVISTEAAIADDRARILVLLDRPEISAQLEARGVKPSDAKARVAALTDAEVAYLSAAMEQAPTGAGGDPLLPVVMALFVIVLLPLLAIALIAKGVSHVAKAAADNKSGHASAVTR
jgi:hypothetical protein